MTSALILTLKERLVNYTSLLMPAAVASRRLQMPRTFIMLIKEFATRTWLPLVAYNMASAVGTEKFRAKPPATI